MTPEQARGNIDIGGPCMIRASAKNFLRVASVVDPADYDAHRRRADADRRQTTLATRFDWPARPLPTPPTTTGPSPTYLAEQPFDAVDSCYTKAG